MVIEGVGASPPKLKPNSVTLAPVVPTMFVPPLWSTFLQRSPAVKIGASYENAFVSVPTIEEIVMGTDRPRPPYEGPETHLTDDVVSQTLVAQIILSITDVSVESNPPKLKPVMVTDPMGGSRPYPPPAETPLYVVR
jgi:hypothetical protein